MSDYQIENVVLGFATNLNPERLEVFAKTLRSVYAPQVCDLVICTNNVNNQLCEISKEYSVTFSYTPNTYSFSVNKFSKLLNRSILYPTKWLALSTQNIPSLRIIFYEMYVQLLKLWHHPHFVRWFTYRDFLKTNPQYKKVFMSDVKDVAFQSPFFDEVDSSELHFFKQDVQYGGDDYWDTKWYGDSYGSKALQKVVGKPAICIGTIMGSFKGVDAFLEVLCAEILKTPFIGIEQSVFNHLFYTDGFNNIPFEVHENAVGPVLTIAGESLNRFKVCPDGVFTVDGKLETIGIRNQTGRSSEMIELILCIRV
ncbi:MAG: hypothetical protein EAZ45_13425 [Oscillatoriales cyanobacterium]|nr:MAG: hypothetical protein EAZ45_13425 [Oscillatoriales cyanobacterium]